MSLEIKGKRWPWIAGAAVLALVVGVGLCEAAGWPFLVAPMQRWLSKTLDREVAFGADGADDKGVRIGLLGSVRVSAGTITIGAPSWSKAPHMVLAKNALLKLGYGDLWRARRGQPLHIRELRADRFDAQIERQADGRASWQFGPPKPQQEPSPAVRLPSFGELRIADGTLVLRDAILGADLDARFSLTERGTDENAGAGASATSAASGSKVAEAPPAKPAGAARIASSVANASDTAESATRPGPVATAASGTPSGLEFSAKGTYRKLPLRVELLTSSIAALAGPNSTEVIQPVTLDATIGRATVTFRGTASDPLHLSGLRGAFRVEGPSLAAVGDPLGVTLPTTGAFKTDGFLTKDGDLWKAVFNRAAIGESRLAGSFTFDRGRKVPLLAGRLTGSRLLLKDLGPVVGGAPKPPGQAEKGRLAADKAKSGAVEKAKSAAADKAKGDTADAAQGTGRVAKDGRVLPDRRFDLPSLRAMDANVLIDIAHVDLGTDLLEPLEPLRTHLRLSGGVLTLTNLEARTAQGRLSGDLSLDGRNSQALWAADLRLLGVRLERWLHQTRKNAAPPYITGQLDGQIKVSGKGRSTAEILGSLDGGMRFHLRDGSLSHLAVEFAGIDIAQALGVAMKGDDAMAINCNVADLAVEKGIARPRLFVIDTRDSTLWIDGSLSLQTEALDLRAVVSPKDFSPMSLRTPIHVKGTFSNPSVSLEASKLGAKVGAAALLALLNPLAAVIPFVDPGARDDAKREAAQCAALAERGNVARLTPPARPSATHRR
ncbi:MAG: AsmA family protein [Caldimonas sp.]